MQADSLAELVESSPDAICVHENGVLTYANRAALDTFAARCVAEVVDAFERSSAIPADDGSTIAANQRI